MGNCSASVALLSASEGNVKENIPVTRDRQPEKMPMEASAAGSWAKGWQAGSCGVLYLGISALLTGLPSTAGRVVGMCFVSA